MILGAGPLQIPAIRKAKEMGLSVVVADMNPDAIGFKESGIIKEVISTTDTSKILKSAKHHAINGIMTVASDVPMPTVATVCESLNLNGISVRTALNATNKAEMRNCLDKAGVPIPKYCVAYSLDQFFELCNNFEEKIVVKASDNSGNRGICLVDYPSDKETLTKAYQYAKTSSHDGRVLLEEYMDGEEFSVEGISVNGTYHVIQVTDKITTGEPYFVEIGHTQPSAQSDETLNKIKAVAKSGVEALGITEGPSHTEIKLTSKGPKIVEIGARLGGGCITSHLVPLSTGVDMIESNIKIALGELPDIESKYSKGAAIRFFKCKAGVFVNIKGLEEAKTLKGVVKIGFFKNIGEYIPELKTGLDRVGYVIAQGETREDAVRTCEDSIRRISIITE